MAIGMSNYMVLDTCNYSVRRFDDENVKVGMIIDDAILITFKTEEDYTQFLEAVSELEIAHDSVQAETDAVISIDGETIDNE